MDARGIGVVIVVLASLSAIGFMACDDSNAVKEVNPGKDSGGPQPGTDSGLQPGTDGGTDGAPSDCFMNPQTHFEIINACTDAVKITKNPTLPLLYPDGGLPPLP